MGILNFENSKNVKSTKRIVIKRKYWYKKTIYVCVLCGIEKTEQYRVYKEDEKGTIFIENACSHHF